jgi:hypothetical protein
VIINNNEDCESSEECGGGEEICDEELTVRLFICEVRYCE